MPQLSHHSNEEERSKKNEGEKLVLRKKRKALEGCDWA